MLIPRRFPVQLKRSIEETSVADEIEDVRHSIQKVSGELMNDFDFVDTLAKATSAGMKTRLHLQT